MMTKNEIEKKQSLLDKLDEAHFSDWFNRYSKTLLISALVIAFVILVGVRLSYRAREKSGGDYLTAKRELAFLQKGNEISFEELHRILQRKPYLQAKYDGLVAQALLNQYRVKEAKPLIERTLKRIKENDLFFYSDYTWVTLWISEGNFDKALRKTKELKDEMIKSAKQGKRVFGDVLFAYNLLRLALLNRQIGNSKEEKEAWQELKRYARVVNEAPPTDLFSSDAFNSILTQYEVGKVSLLQSPLMN